MPNTWTQDIVEAMINLGGSARYKELYDEIYKLRNGRVPQSFEEVVRRTIQTNSSDSKGFQGVDIFYSVSGLGNGHWGLRERIQTSPKAADIPAVYEDHELYQTRVLTSTYRILRDTVLARTIKEIHDNQCQLCGIHLSLSDGRRYSEAHHVQPLGDGHSGPDVEGNILVLCPNHHALCDMKSMGLDLNELRLHPEHRVDQTYIDYHNRLVEQALTRH